MDWRKSITGVFAVFSLLVFVSGAASEYPAEELGDRRVPDGVRIDLVSTGILDDLVVRLVNPGRFNGEPGSLSAGLRVWKQLYFQMRNSYVHPSALPGVNTLMDEAALYARGGKIPLLMMNFVYNVLPGYFRDDGKGDQLAPRAEDRTYPEKRLFAVAPFRERSYRGSEVVFKMERELCLSNSKAGTGEVRIDFGDGLGFRKVPFDEDIRVSYLSTGKKIIRTRLCLDDGTLLEARSDFLVESLETPDPDDTLSITSTIPYQGGYAGGEAYIYLAPGRSSLWNPVIVVEGFDIDNTMNWDEIYFLMNKEELLESMRIEGFDLVVLNFDEATDYIQRNSMLAVELIQAVRGLIYPGKSIVVIGASMGGLVARYALAYMESNGIEHGVETFISFDSPHRGANIPLGVQYWMDFFSEQSVEAAYLLERLDTPAARQMLVYHHTVPPTGSGECDPLKTELEADFAALGGYPSTARKVAIANGSGSRAGQGYTAGDQIIFYEYSSFLVDITGNVWAVGDGSATLIFEGLIDMIWPLPDEEMNVTVSGTEPYDCAPGGCRFTMVQMDTSEVTYGDIVALHDRHCFIPTVSALDIETEDLYHDISGDPEVMSLTPFDTIYYSSMNTEHVEINAENAPWFREEVRRTVTGIDEPVLDIPSAASLFQNVPNPFNPSTVISFSLPGEMSVVIDVFDPAGRRIASLADGKQTAGVHRIIWKGTDDKGKPLASGVYICRLSAGGSASTIKMVLLR